MIKIRNSILIALAVVAMSMTVNAQVANESLFNANEFSVRMAVLNPMDIGTQYTFDAKASSLAGFELGMGYYISRYIGVEASVPVWKSDTRCFQSVSAGIMARLPMDTFLTGSIWSHLAPYARVGMGFNECQTSPYNAYIGGGLEARLNRTISMFGGVVYSQRGVFAPDSWGVIRPEVGMRLSF